MSGGTLGKSLHLSEPSFAYLDREAIAVASVSLERCEDGTFSRVSDMGRAGSS